MVDDYPQGVTNYSLHHEMKIHFANLEKAIGELSKDIDEVKFEAKRINGRVRMNQLWIARLQGALALLAILGVGNIIALYAGGI